MKEKGDIPFSFYHDSSILIYEIYLSYEGYMTITRDTTISEIQDILNQEHCIRYNIIKSDRPLLLSQKHNGFGSYIFIHQGEGILISIKCSSDYESKLLCKQLVIKALEELGYEIEDK